MGDGPLMGERTVMHEALIYTFGLEQHVPTATQATTVAMPSSARCTLEPTVASCFGTLSATPLAVPDQPVIPYLPDLIRCRGYPA
jgi:hypothetical protein